MCSSDCAGLEKSPYGVEVYYVQVRDRDRVRVGASVTIHVYSAVCSIMVSFTYIGRFRSAIARGCHS